MYGIQIAGHLTASKPNDVIHRCWVKHTQDGIENMTIDKNGITCNAGSGSILQGKLARLYSQGNVDKGMTPNIQNQQSRLNIIGDLLFEEQRKLKQRVDKIDLILKSMHSLNSRLELGKITETDLEMFLVSLEEGIRHRDVKA